MSILQRTSCLLLVAAFLLVTAHRLPAPIQEVPESPTPAPTVASAKPKPKPKPKSTDTESTSPSRQLDGVWMGTEEGNNQKVAMTLVIKGGKTAAETFEKTNKPDTYWNDVPDSARRATIYFRMKRDSSNLSLEGSVLTIQWRPFTLLDWTPRSIPYSWFAEGETSRKLFQDTERTQYTLDGDKLVSKGVVFHRAR